MQRKRRTRPEGLRSRQSKYVGTRSTLITPRSPRRVATALCPGSAAADRCARALEVRARRTELVRCLSAGPKQGCSILGRKAGWQCSEQLRQKPHSSRAAAFSGEPSGRVPLSKCQPSTSRKGRPVPNSDAILEWTPRAFRLLQRRAARHDYHSKPINNADGK
jgi:hypothetical protein